MLQRMGCGMAHRMTWFAVCRFHLPNGLQLANLLSLQEKAQRSGEQGESGQLLQARDTSHGSGLFQLFAKEVDDSLTWDFMPWLRSITKLPIWIKVRSVTVHINPWG